MSPLNVIKWKHRHIFICEKMRRFLDGSPGEKKGREQKTRQLSTSRITLNGQVSKKNEVIIIIIKEELREMRINECVHQHAVELT